MNKTLVLALAGAFTLAACGSKTDANEKNFGAAISQYLDKKGELCLRLNKWPVDVTEFDLKMQQRSPTGKASQMAALAKLGLVTEADAEVEDRDMFGKRMFKVKRYTLTDAGRPFYRELDGRSIGMAGVKDVKVGDLCYGQKALDKVVKWDGPMKFGDYQEARITYLYKIDKLADWTKKPEFTAAFPYVTQMIEGAGKKEQVGGVKLTSIGWEPHGLN